MVWIAETLLNNLLIVMVIELPAAFLLGARNFRKITTVMLANLITNPVVVFCSLVTMLFASDWSVTVLIISEIAAFLCEGYIFYKFRIFDKKNAWLISLCLNLISFGAGEIIEKIF